jgi:hypothetical protein
MTLVCCESHVRVVRFGNRDERMSHSLEGTPTSDLTLSMLAISYHKHLSINSDFKKN